MNSCKFKKYMPSQKSFLIDFEIFNKKFSHLETYMRKRFRTHERTERMSWLCSFNSGARELLASPISIL